MGFRGLPFDQFTNLPLRQPLEISIRSAHLVRKTLLRFYDVMDDARDAARLRRRLKPELLRRYLREFGDESRPPLFPNVQHFFHRHFDPPIFILVSLYGNERDLLPEFARKAIFVFRRDCTLEAILTQGFSTGVFIMTGRI